MSVLRTAAIRSLAGLCVAGVLAGCGSSSHSSSSNSTAATGPTSAPNAAALVKARVAAASCMRAQGIDIPDPGASPGSVLSVLRVLSSYPQAKVQAAGAACASEIHQAFPNATNLTPAQRAQRLQRAVAFAACMRSHGIAFPDPSTAASNAAGFYQALQALNTNSPAVQAAGKTCRSLTLNTTGG